MYYRAPYSSVPGVKKYLPREKSMPSGRVVNMDEVIDLTSLLHEDGSITWEVPSGNWTVMRFGLRNNGAVTRPAPLPGVGFECDKTDTAAIAAHFKVFTDELLRVVGERDTTLPGGLKMLHMDSWEMGAQNWAPGLREEFRRRRGYDPQPYYPAYDGYIVGSREISERFLWDLRQTMQELMLENHALYVKEYAHRRGMKLSIEPYDMNPMQDLELGASADIPMCEFWSPGGYNTSFSAIEGSSIGNLKGERLVPAEAFTAAGDGWKQHPASMKNQTDWAFAAGINRLTYHTFQHQAEVRDGKICFPQGAQYELLVMPDFERMTPELLSKIQSLVMDGAAIVGLPPKEAPGLSGYPDNDREVQRIAREMWGGGELPSGLEKRIYGKGAVYFGSALKEQEDNLYPAYPLTESVLEERQVAKDFTSSSNSVRYIHKQRGATEYYFVADRTGKQHHTVCTFRVSGKVPQLWDSVTGEMLAISSYTDDGSCISVELGFAPYQSYFLVFRRESPRKGLKAADFAEKREVQTLDRPWTVSFDPEWGGPRKAVFNTLQDWSEHPSDSIRYYSGTAVYTTQFEFHPGEGRYFLDLGEVNNMARVSVNGHDLGIVWTSPWEVELTGALKEGANELTVEVTNLWVNRLIGDERNPEQRYTYTTFRHYDANSPLLPSGLSGPVRILTAE